MLLYASEMGPSSLHIELPLQAYFHSQVNPAAKQTRYCSGQKGVVYTERQTSADPLKDVHTVLRPGICREIGLTRCAVGLCRRRCKSATNSACWPTGYPCFHVLFNIWLKQPGKYRGPKTMFVLLALMALTFKGKKD